LPELVGGASGLGWVAVKAVLMFAVAVVGLRLGERRTLAQLGAFDFAVAVAIGAIIGRTVTASSASFATGAVGLVTVLVVHRLVAFARRHGRFARLVDHPPRVLVARGATTLVRADGDPGPRGRLSWRWTVPLALLTMWACRRKAKVDPCLAGRPLMERTGYEPCLAWLPPPATRFGRAG